jgi:predicted transposase YdaD
MPISRTPHDDFFYQVMSRKEKAKTFFERYLPKAVQEVTNLEEITLAESKHVSDAGISLYNDVLYRCELAEGQPGYLFAMCEHQSTPDDQMPLRLLKYNIATIEKHLKQAKERFPVIVNIVLYHGSKPWNYSTAFSDYYANPTLGKAFLDMAPFTLINIPRLSKSAIHEDKELGFCFEAFRCTSQPDPYEAFESTMHEPAFKTYFDRLPKELRNLVLAYLGKCIDREKHSLEDLINLVSSNPQEKTEIMTSIAQAIGQEYEKKGRQQGMQQGMQEEKLHIAKNMLSKGFASNLIQELSGISEEEFRQLEKTYSADK